MRLNLRVILFLISVLCGRLAEAHNRSMALENTIIHVSSLSNSGRISSNPSFSLDAGINSKIGTTFAPVSSVVNTKHITANIQPTIVLKSPGTGAVFNQNDVINITATASDRDGSVSKVEFFVDNVLIGEDTSSPYELTWTATNAKDYSIKAKATDNLQEVTISDPAKISVLAGTGKIYRILPLGNSITYDNRIGDTRPIGERTSYRYKLGKLLQEDGYRIDFLGSKYSGYDLFTDANNGGVPGIRTGEVFTMLSTGYNPHNRIQETPGAYLETYAADIILLHIGTNNVTKETTDLEKILDEIDNYERSHNVTIMVILAQIINRVSYSSTTSAYNKNMKTMAEARIANGDKIVLVNMEQDAGMVYSTAQPGGDMADDLHPLDSGYEKMASVWYHAIKTVMDPIAPILISPENNATKVSVSPTLSWEAAAGANSYNVQVSTNPNFTSVIFDQSNITQTSVAVTNLINNTSYYWRVKAANAAGTSTWSPVRNFTTAPRAQLTTVNIASNNSNNSRAKAGDVITLSFTANVPIQVSQVTIAGQAATLTPAGNAATAFTATYTMKANDPEGPVAFSINFQDVENKVPSSVTATTNNSSVIFDRTAPLLSNVTIASNNADITKAKVGDVISVSLTANEPIQLPIISIAGHHVSVNPVSSGSVTNFIATYTLTENEQQDLISFNISFADLTGNTGIAVSTTTNNSQVSFDKTAPVLTVVTIASNNADHTKAKTGNVITVSFTANEPIQVLQVLIAGKSTAVTPAGNSSTTFTATYTLTENDPEGPVALRISYKDNSGNPGNAVSGTTNKSSDIFDKTAPVLNMVTIASSNADAARAKVGDVVTVSFMANEPIAEPQVIIAGHTVSATESSANAFTAAYTIKENDQEGTVGFSISFQDIAGNSGSVVSTTTNNSKVIFDQTAPNVVISSSIGNSTNSNPIPLLITFSEAVYGLEISDFTTNNGRISNLQTSNNKSYTADFTPNANGIVSVTLAAAKVVDVAANANQSSNTWSSAYDGTRPIIVLTTDAAAVTNAPFIISIVFSEPVNNFGSEDITLDNGKVSDFKSLSASQYTALITPTAQGEVKVEISANKAADVATNGNLASAMLKLIYDSIAPAGYSVAFNEKIIDIAQQKNVLVKVKGAETGIPYYYTITSTAGGTPVTNTGTASRTDFDIAALDVSGLADGTLTITFYQQDAAGNKGLSITAEAEKVTRNIVSVTMPTKLTVPFHTTFENLPLPATVEVTYSDNTKQNIPVTWAAGTYQDAVAGDYEIIGTLILAPGTSNQQNMAAIEIVEVEPNKAPTALALSATTFSPDILPTQVIGTFTTTDIDDNEHAYTLVNGQDDSDNSLFEIRGNALYLQSNKGLSGKTQFTIRVSTTDPYHNSLEQTFSLSKETYAKAVADLKIVNAFSPNGDGVNDEWTIPELKFYNQVALDVFDRSGERLFHTTNPEQGWDGKDNNGLVRKGSFLYVIQVKDINLVKKGVVSIVK